MAAAGLCSRFLIPDSPPHPFYRPPLLSPAPSFHFAFSASRSNGTLDRTLPRRLAQSPRAESLSAPASTDSQTSSSDGRLPENMPTSMFSPILGSVSTAPLRTSSKVTVVGVGNVGMACAQTCLTQELVNELALVDVQADKLRGEMLDLQHAAAFFPQARIVADTDYKVTAGSDICIITAGARQRPGETRLSLVDRNVNLFKSIIPKLVEHSPEAILLVVSNPVDILAYVSWKLSGFPPNRVIGSGTNLDSSRLRFLVAERFGVSAQNIHGYVVGEHGDSSVALWSSVTVANVPVVSNLYDREGRRCDEGALQEMHGEVVGSADEVIRLKGYTSWAIGYSAASLVRSLLRDHRRIHPVSVRAQGFQGIQEDVFLSLPAQLGRTGVLGVANVPFSPSEARKVQASAKGLWDIHRQLQL